MKSRSLLLPALVFIGGAVIARYIGLRPLARGALTAATVAGLTPGVLIGKTASHRSRRRSRHATVRASRKKPILKKSKAA